MKIAAIICNLVLFGSLCLVLVEDGLPVGTFYIFFTVWSLLTIILNSIVICQIARGRCLWDSDIKRRTFDVYMSKIGFHSGNSAVKSTAILCNAVFLLLVCFAIIEQYPHPEEKGLILFTVLMILNPVISILALMRIR